MSILNNEITTPRQAKNGTRMFQCFQTGDLYGSYASGYVRRKSASSNSRRFYQLNPVNVTKQNIKMKNGFINSTGWKLKKYKFNHLLAPFTSIPINGTTDNKIKKIRKQGTKVLFKKSLFKKEIKIIKQKDRVA